MCHYFWEEGREGGREAMRERILESRNLQAGEARGDECEEG